MLGTQKTSGRNVDDAPPSEKGDSENWVVYTTEPIAPEAQTCVAKYSKFSLFSKYMCEILFVWSSFSNK